MKIKNLYKNYTLIFKKKKSNNKLNKNRQLNKVLKN